MNLFTNSIKMTAFVSFMLFICACIHLSGAADAAPQDDVVKQQTQNKWLRMGGTWTVQNGRVFESRIRPLYWDLHELINYNSLLVDNLESDFTEINTKFGLTNVQILPVEIMFTFSIRGNIMQDFFAIKFNGDAKGIQSVTVIRSTQKDASLPATTKKNYTIETLYEQACSLKYDSEYGIKIVKNNNYFKGAVINLYIDNKLIFSKDFPIAELKEKGKFAVASRGASISIDYVTIKNGGKTVFTDDFSENSIYVPTVSATKVEK